jgi:hypothetical protein
MLTCQNPLIFSNSLPGHLDYFAANKKLKYRTRKQGSIRDIGLGVVMKHSFFIFNIPGFFYIFKKHLRS